MSNDGGSAFPNITPDMNVNGGPGMSLRDYFAAQMINQAFEAAMCLPDSTYKDAGLNRHQITAVIAYELADAMLAERVKAKTDG